MKKCIILLLAAAMLLCCAACAKPEAKTVNICVLAGPTGVGAAGLMERSSAGKAEQPYRITVASAPDEAAAKLSGGEADLAAIATNLAAKLYRKTDGGIRIIAVNTLGVLSVLDNTGAQITSLADLKGRSIVTTGQGANPQFILEYLLRKNGLDPQTDVQILYYADGSALPAVWATEPEAVIVAPCPVSTSILMKYKDAQKVLDLTQEWEKCSPDSALMMGCIVARTAFCEEHPQAVEAFLNEYAASIQAAQDDPAHTGALCEKFGVVPNAAVAEKAVPDCHLCCITGNEMKEKLTGYLGVLYEADASSVGAMPDDGFWYGVK